MTSRGRFFQQAELDSNWPFQFLIIIFGMVLAMFEGGLALCTARGNGCAVLAGWVEESGRECVREVAVELVWEVA